MIEGVKKIPTDITELTELVIELRRQLNLEELKYEQLEEKYKILQQRFFGRSSEKMSDVEKGQQLLFNEAEEGCTSDQGSEEDEASDIIMVPEHKRKKKGRKRLPKDLPREEVEHDLPDNEKRCPCCNNERPRIGEKTSEELDIIPAKIKVIKHIYPKYGPCKCEEFKESELPEVIQTPATLRMIAKSIVSPGLLAYVITGKFVDALPFYRQEKIFARIGVTISRASMCNWIIHASGTCSRLLELLWEDLLSGPLVQMDETPVQVLKEPGKSPGSKSYMWVTVGYPNGKRVIIFHYHPSRSQNIPLEILKNYQGYLQTDGYDGYNAVGELPGIIHVGCNAHSRRKFHEASLLSQKAGAAHVGLSYIRKIYKEENELRDKGLPDDEFVKQRKQTVKPILKEFKEWLLVKRDQVPPKTKLGEAIYYTLSQWEKLIRYLEAAYLTPDNNIPENAIRPFVIGRKNWLFCDTRRGAHASATFYSLIETAKANGLDPYRYLRFLFTRLPFAKSDDELRALLPNRVSPDQLREID